VADRPTPDTELVDPFAGDGFDQPHHDVSDDDLAAALAAVFGLPSDDAADEEASEWTPPLEPALPSEPVTDASAPPDAAAVALDPPPLPPDERAGSWWDDEPDAVVDPPPPSAEPDRSAAALQDAGFGSPLSSALGELGRMIPDRGVETPAAADNTEVPAVGALYNPDEPAPLPSGRRPEWLSGAGLRQVWEDHRRDWGPGLIVAALVLVAFIVVLSAGGRDRTPAGVESGSRSTTVPTTVDASTTLFQDTIPPEVPIEPDGAAVADDGSAIAVVTPRRSTRPSATAPPATKPRPKAGVAPPPAASADPADPPSNPPDDGPPATSPPPQTTLPPTTSPPPQTTVPRIDPCAHIEDPLAQQACRRQNRGG
jgi:hypothetical protein